MEDRMVKKRGKEIYQPPYAQDLSGFSANGQVKPTGYCTDGSAPVDWTCTAGDAPPAGSGTCNPAGGIPAVGGCNVGTNAVQGCAAGSVHTL